MNAGYRNEFDAARAQADALRNENALLARQLEAARNELARERAHHRAQLANARRAQLAPAHSTPGGALVLGAMMLLALTGTAGYLLLSQTAAVPPPMPAAAPLVAPVVAPPSAVPVTIEPSMPQQGTITTRHVG